MRDNAASNMVHLRTPAFWGGRSLHPTQRIGAAPAYARPTSPAPLGGSGAFGGYVTAAPTDLRTPPVLTPAVQGVLATRNGKFHV